MNHPFAASNRPEDRPADGWLKLALPLTAGMSSSPTHGGMELWDTSIVPDNAGLFGQISNVQFTVHLGTHVDAPRHFIASGKTIDQYPMERFIGTAAVLDLRGRRGGSPVQIDDLIPHTASVEAAHIVLLCFGWGALFGTEDYRDHPYLSLEAAKWLADRAPSIVGADTLSLDLPAPRRPENFDYPVHQHLLSRDVLVIEGLSGTLADVAGSAGFLQAVPVNFVGADGAPVVPVFLRD